jgi:hypothetical protein
VKYKQTLIEPGIIKIEVSEKAVLDLEDVLAMRRKNLELSRGEKFCILWDSRNVHFTIDPEAMHKMASAEYQEVRKAAALIVDSLAGKLVGNFFKSLTSQKSPTRLFNSEEEGLKWLRKF